MNIFDFFLKDFLIQKKWSLIIYLILTSLLLFSRYIINPIIYSQIIMSLNLNKYDKFYQKFYFLIGIWVFIFIIYFFINKLEGDIYPSYISQIRTKLIDLTIENSNNNLIDIKIGNHLLRILHDSHENSQAIKDMLYTIIPSILGIFIIGIYILIINWKIGLLLLFGLLLIIICFLYFSKEIIGISEKQSEFYYNNVDKLNSKFSNLSNIYLNNQKEDEINNSTIDQQEYKKIMSKKINIMNIINIFLYFISILFFILAIFMGYKFYKNNILSKQNYILILIILTYFIGLFLRIANILPNLLSYTGYAINSFKYFKDLFKDNKINKNNIKINSGTLKIENLTYYYEINNEKKYIFNNINLEINSGERVAIYGRSGFGKSTLAKLIMNLYKYDGKIFLDNNDIKFMNDNILRSNIIYINQKTELFEDTIFENIRYGNKISNDDIINIINKYELNNIFENLKQNYNTNCGVRGNNLSLGMQKIIILLRAYFKFKESKVIIFDEPLAGLDYHTKKKILKFISEIEKDKTIIIITHDEEIFSIVDRKINIENISLSS